MQGAKIFQRLLGEAKKWSGRPGYLGFTLLGFGMFVSGMRRDDGMGMLLVTAMIAFIGEQVRMWKMVGKNL